MAWDDTMRIVEGKSDQELAHIVYSRFANGDTKNGIKYSLGGLYVRRIITRVSKTAWAKILEINPDAAERGKGVYYNKLEVRKMGITREHVIPVAELFEHFSRRKKLTEKYICDFIPRLEIALITEKENKKLIAAHLNSAMPAGWWASSKLDPLDRYRAAGLDDSIWMKWIR